MTKRILVLAANPEDTSRLRLDQEVREIDNGLQRAQKRDEFILKQQWAARPKDVRRAMLDFKPNIVHFCGHGAGIEGIAFEDETGHSKLVSAEALAGLFELFADKVECVLLNACYSETQAEAIAHYIDYVIGMREGIGDTAAIEFAVAFYDALGAGESTEFAYRLACNAIQWGGTQEHSTPILKSKAYPTKRAAFRSLKIMVTGGRETTKEVMQLAYFVGQQVVLRGHTLMSNGSIGVDQAASEGALATCRSKKLDPNMRIQVFRPRTAPAPHFDFGNLQIVGQDYSERRNLVIQRSDAIILLGGHGGTRKVARQARITEKPIIPIGIGQGNETSVELWYRMQREYVDSLPSIRINDEDLQRIGPGQRGIENVSLSAVLIAERLAQSQAKV